MFPIQQRGHGYRYSDYVPSSPASKSRSSGRVHLPEKNRDKKRKHGNLYRLLVACLLVFLMATATTVPNMLGSSDDPNLLHDKRVNVLDGDEERTCRRAISEMEESLALSDPNNKLSNQEMEQKLKEHAKSKLREHWNITTIIPTCGTRLHALKDAIDSAINQTYSVHQILVAVDSGPDCIKASQLKNVWNDSRIQFLQVPKRFSPRWIYVLLGRGGPGLARNVACAHASPTTTHFAFLDDDDVWLPEKTQLQVALMQQLQAKWSSSDCWWPTTNRSRIIRDDNQQHWGENHEKCVWEPFDLSYQHRSEQAFRLTNGGMNLEKILSKLQLSNSNTTKLPCHVTHELLQRHNILTQSSTILAKEWFQPYADERRDQDYFLWLRLLQQPGKRALLINTPLFVYDNKRYTCDDPSTSPLV